MKFQSVKRIKIFVALLSVLFVVTVLICNSKPGLTVVQAKDGAQIYAASCSRCHGTDGRAQTSKGRQTGAKDLTSAKWQPNEARAIRAITNGKGRMPGFKGTLSAEEISLVWTYIRDTFR
ncbi:MAG TPA: cytochrome c [Pyrinomonadaceae bacterium]|jgi:cytochrome c6